MPTVDLTDRFCQTVKPAEKGQTDHFDKTVKGLCLRVGADSKSWYLVYTRPDGKRARLKIGTYPELSLAKARQKARETRAAVGEGNDPAADKASQRASLTVAELVESYIVRSASKAKRGDEIARRLRHDVVPTIGKKAVADLHRRDLTRCIDAVMDRGAPAAANRLYDDVRAMIRWAKGRGDLDVNLVEGMQRPAENVERDRVLSADEIAIVWKALPGANMTESTRRLLRLCLVTAQRVGEVAAMKRDEVDLDRLVWSIPAANAKNGREHNVPLSPMAAGIIRDQLADLEAHAARMERPAPPFLFPAPGGRAAMTRAAASRGVRRQGATADDGQVKIMGVDQWTPHDLRRTAATHMEESGISPYVIGHILNHATTTKATITSRVYARYTYDREKREALELWANRLSAIVSEGAKVIPIGAAQRK